MAFKKEQTLNEWVRMLDTIYGHTQNYSKSGYEISSHLLEVVGAFGKYLLKKRQPDRAIEFLPKIFAWTAALLIKAKGPEANAAEILLTKFPSACPYCCAAPCQCWKKEKSPLDENSVRNLRYTRGDQQRTSLNDLQLMFRTIYEDSWGVKGSADLDAAYSAIRTLHSRLVEELSELAEALRFHHLHPSNFDNELSDVLAWWFAIVSSLHYLSTGDPTKPGTLILAEDLMWDSYPGYCKTCGLELCDCRPGPVRELLSKPSMGDLAAIDELTQASNRKRFDQDLTAFAGAQLPLVFPVAFISVSVRAYHSTKTRTAADELMAAVASLLRLRIRTRDRLYRVGDSHFLVLLTDYSKEEALGFVKRLDAAAQGQPRGNPELDCKVIDCAERSGLNAAADNALSVPANRGALKAT